MLAGHPEICLYQPEIPQNTGSIGRLVAGTQCRLHLIRPLGFDTSDRNLRRAGLDYWPFLDLEIHDSIEPLLERFRGRVAFIEKHVTQMYDVMPATAELLVFGRETTGIPEELLRRHPEACFGIPMFHPGVRSLNLANAVSIVLYHQLGQRRGHTPVGTVR